MVNLRYAIMLLFVQVCALSAAGAALAQAPSVVSNVAHQRGIELYRQGNFSAAADHFKATIKQNKEDDVSWHYLGLILTKQNKLKDASKAFENALKIRPDFAIARTSLSYVLMLQNKPLPAIQQARRALSVDPTIAEAHYVIGIIRLSEGYPEEALEKAKEAIRLDPNMPAAYLLRSLAVLARDTRKTMEGFKSNTGPTPIIPQPVTPDELQRRRLRRAEEAASFIEAAESLEYYLNLNPVDSTTELWREQLETLRLFANNSSPDKNKTESNDRLWRGEELSTRVRVLEKPEPTYTDPARYAGVTGMVVLRAVFTGEGTVRHILILRGLPYGLTEQAIKAARGIKFIPATVNGRPVSTVLQLEYSFNLYLKIQRMN